MITIRHGDCRDVLRALASESVHCVVTSPPYWGLRDYGIPPSIWGGSATCEHEWIAEVTARPNSGGGEGLERDYGGAAQFARESGRKTTAAVCSCGAWRGVHGLEPTYQLYVENAVAIFREVRRVLRKDGTLWLNLGDSYASSGVSGKQSNTSRLSRHGYNGFNPKMADQVFGRAPTPFELKTKDLIGIPWRVAFALQADGWYLRQDIIWSKPNPMPESVRDRCTKAHEYLFLLSKSERYYYDGDAIAEPTLSLDPEHPSFRPNSAVIADEGRKEYSAKHKMSARSYDAAGRNKRSVWTVTTCPYSEAHFATFPPALIEPCIMAGTSEKGCCAKCGAPWVRQVERTRTNQSGSGRAGNPPEGKWGLTAQHAGTMQDIRMGPTISIETIGWSPSCACNAVAVPCTVLDPFAGAGTTGLVADRLGRNAILIELNPDYVAMIERRISADAGMFAQIYCEAAE
jgi:DNA modification methylase